MARIVTWNDITQEDGSTRQERVVREETPQEEAASSEATAAQEVRTAENVRRRANNDVVLTKMAASLRVDRDELLAALKELITGAAPK